MPNGYEDRLFAKLMTAIAKFHEKHGDWPTELLIPEGVKLQLQGLLDEFKYKPVEGRLILIADNKSFFVAKGANGSSYKLRLDKDGYSDHAAVREAMVWLVGRSFEDFG